MAGCRDFKDRWRARLCNPVDLSQLQSHDRKGVVHDCVMIFWEAVCFGCLLCEMNDESGVVGRIALTHRSGQCLRLRL
jgi:hypothetical protein